MNKLLTFSLISLCLFNTCCIAKNSFDKETHLTKKNKVAEWIDSVGQLAFISPKGSTTATGFSISPKHILTAGHFCSFAEKTSKEHKVDLNIQLLFLLDGKYISIDGLTIAKVDEDNDLCLLDITDNPLIPLEIDSHFNDKVGDKVYTISSPKSVFPWIGEGYLIGIDGVHSLIDPMLGLITDDMVITSIFATGGSSGSPVLNEKGKVIGMTTFVLTGELSQIPLSLGPGSKQILDFFK